MSDTNWAVQSQKMVIGLKLWIKEAEELFYLCIENKGADQLCCYRTADFSFVFAYMQKFGFSQDAAHLMRLKDNLAYFFIKIYALGAHCRGNSNEHS